MTVGTQYRVSGSFADWYLGGINPFRVEVYENVLRGGVLTQEPHDLEQYDEVHLLIMDSEADGSARQDVSLTVQTAAADKVTNSSSVAVACAAAATFTPTGAAGSVVCKIMGKIGSTFYWIGKPWKAEVRLGGPTS